MSDDQRPAQVAEAHPAVLEMLESLLAEVPEAEPAPAPAPAPKARVAPAPLAEPAQVPAPKPLAEPPAAPLSTTLNNPAPEPLTKTRECVFHGLGKQPLDTPESRFSAIKFTVGRYPFVAPLNMLDGVIRVEGRPTPMFGQADWHRGITLSRGQQLTLVDLGALLGLDDTEPVAEPDHVLLLPDGRHGIISSSPPVPLTLSGSDIRWSGPDNGRPWMAALLREHMCVLVDVEAFLDMLQARIRRT